MTELTEVIAFCDNRTERQEVPDFPGSENGLQVANDGKVTKVGAAVDAGLEPFGKAIASGIDLLIVHHGLYWTPPLPLVGPAYDKVKLLPTTTLHSTAVTFRSIAIPRSATTPSSPANWNYPPAVPSSPTKAWT